MNYKHYLPNTTKRIEYLKKVIRGRPVAILLPGQSIYELEKRIGELKECDICYASINEFWIMEKYILSKINKKLDIVMCSAYECDIPSEPHIEFLERPDENIFISTEAGFHEELGGSLKEFAKKYNKKLLFFITDEGFLAFEIPNEEHPLHFTQLVTFSILISLSIIGGASRIVLFGADGGHLKEDEDLFYRGWTANPEAILAYDRTMLNEMFPAALERVYKTHNLLPVEIINCSKKSWYKVFNWKMSYDETFRVLK